MAIAKSWMEMTPKKGLHIFRLKCYLCGGETEVFSDEVYKNRKCCACKEIITPSNCEVIQFH